GDPDDPVDAEVALPARPLPHPPQEGDAPCRVAGPGVFDHARQACYRSKCRIMYGMIYDEPPAIVAEGLRKRYGKVNALDGFDLAVPEGTVCGLLGRNGTGKTTAVRVLSTLLQPDGGRARVAGCDVTRDPWAVRRRIGFVGQHAAVDEALSGRQNLEMFARLHHLTARASRRRAAELLDQYGLAGDGDRLVKQYSGGMRRRLDMAASLVLTPAVLFLDEPTTGLDPRGRLEVWECVRALVGAGTT